MTTAARRQKSLSSTRIYAEVALPPPLSNFNFTSATFRANSHADLVGGRSISTHYERCVRSTISDNVPLSNNCFATAVVGIYSGDFILSTVNAGEKD